jgi:hypothetical protein
MGSIKSGMRVGFNIKVSAEVQSDVKALTEITRDIFIKQQNHLAVKKSTRVLKWDIRIWHDGDDVVRNLITALFTGKGYRISRIIKRFYK